MIDHWLDFTNSPYPRRQLHDGDNDNNVDNDVTEVMMICDDNNDDDKDK